MDPVKMEKLQAMAKYKKTQFYFLRQLIKYTFFVILLGLSLSCPLWLHPLCCIKFFVFVSVPKAITYVLRPKILFAISNIIVFILVVESKLLGSPNSGPDIYDEYVKKKKRYNQRPTVPASAGKEACYEEKAAIEKSIVKVRNMDNTTGEEENGDEDGEEMETEKSMDLEEEEKETKAKRGMEELEEKKEEDIEAEEGMEELEGEEEEENCGLPVDELNKRAEEFIAKVNHQRRLEARMLLCKEDSQQK